MRIAIVTPLVTRVFGNRCAFVIARELARSHDVTLMAHSVSEDIVPEVRRQIGAARLDCIRTIPPARQNMGRLFYWQLTRGADRALAGRLRRGTDAGAFDAVVVFADEGHWIGPYLANWPPAERPVTAVCLLELVDHPFLLRATRPNPTLRRLAMPAYPLVHFLEAGRLRSFDLRFGTSRWASTQAEYLYGEPTDGELSAYDDSLFSPPETPVPGEPYLALPTASLDARGLSAVRQLTSSGIRLVAFGPQAAPGAENRGYLSDSEMVELLRSARGTLILFDYEALGLMPIESLATGTPVITEPHQGPLLEHRGNPFVQFATDHPSRLAACRQLLTQAKTPESMRACQATVDRFRPGPVAAVLLAQIERMRAARGAPPAAG